jgi:hypothetical protein
MAISLRKPIITPAAKTPQTVAERLRHHMALIAELFDNPKMTLVIRSATLEGDLIVTNDEAGEAITAIKKYCETNKIRLDS